MAIAEKTDLVDMERCAKCGYNNATGETRCAGLVKDDKGNMVTCGQRLPEKA